MLSVHAKGWFMDFYNLSAVVIYTLMGMLSQDKHTILMLLIYMFLGLVVKFSPLASLVIGILLAIPLTKLIL